MTLAVRKTYKLFIGGKFPRSESGRSYVFASPNQDFQANVSLASRKDVRDAVVAARAAFAGWSNATAYNRGQVLYRIAEMVESRREQFGEEVSRESGRDAKSALAEVIQAIETWVWYAGWSDKIDAVAGNLNPVAGPFFNITSYQPSGVIGLIPKGNGLLDLVRSLAPAIVSGNTAVLLAAEKHPLSAVALAEVLATSDLPGGVANILTGKQSELAPWLAAHEDVNGLDLEGAEDAAALSAAAAQTLKRLWKSHENKLGAQSLERVLAHMEAKTVWHPKGY